MFKVATLRIILALMLLGHIVILSLAPACSLRYLIHVARSQLLISFNLISLESALADTKTTPESREKLLIVQRVREFAGVMLGLSAGNNYTSICTTDIRMYGVSAAPPDKLSPFQWYFPVIGPVPYLGFFSKDLAQQELARLMAMGLETNLVGVSAYSTLGWFNDAILPDFLSRNEAQLAGLMIHELTHGTMYFPGKAEFNENLATFVGNEGSMLYLRTRYGADSQQYKDAEAYFHDSLVVSEFTAAALQKLQTFYDSNPSRKELLLLRDQLFTRIVADYDRLTAGLKTGVFKNQFKKKSLNNAVLLSMARYRSRLDLFNRLLAQQGGDLPRTIQFLKSIPHSSIDPFQTIIEKVGTE